MRENRQTTRGQNEAETVPPVHRAGNDQPLAKVRKSISDWECAGSWPFETSGLCAHIHVRTKQPTAFWNVSSSQWGESLWYFVTRS